jgi:hypothetical protein
MKQTLLNQGTWPAIFLILQCGHPYYTQLLAQQALLLQGKLKVGPRRIFPLLEETLYVEKDYLERLWENISENRQQKVVMLAPYRPLIEILDQEKHPEN